METEPKKSPQENLAPSRWVRLAWWFGIFVAGFVPLIIFAVSFTKTPGELILMFPVVLGTIFELLGNWLPQLNFEAAHRMFCYLGPTIYFCHLLATLWVKSRRYFVFLLITLVVLLIINYGILGFYFYIFRGG